MKPIDSRHFPIFLLYVLLSMGVAGIFGALHDQISYTVSPEYFTRFKFLQFDLLDAGVPERFRAAKVGFLASWWMGLPLGLLTGVAGGIQRSPRQRLRALLWSWVVIVGFSLLFALGGLWYGYLQTANLDLADYHGWFLPDLLQHPRNFICVGYMHNAAYLGGVLSIPAAWVFHWIYRSRSIGDP